MVDISCDAFENANSTLTDEQFELLSIKTGFNEDAPMIRFEEDLAFCSLRKYIYNKETYWLSQQGDGEWDLSTDPDSHFIDDDTERALLNQGSEVIIGDLKTGYVIYKFYEWGVVEIHNNDFVALQQMNTTGTIPTNNPNVQAVNNTTSKYCTTEVERRNSFDTGGNTKIKTLDKTKNFSGAPAIWKSSKIKSKTKYYRKKAGIWTRGKTTITAGFEGNYLEGNYFAEAGNCGVEVPLDETRTKRRSKVKAKHIRQADVYINVDDNKLFGVHKRRSDVIKKVDYFDNDIL
jgi:hypothetical protein